MQLLAVKIPTVWGESSFYLCLNLVSSNKRSRILRFRRQADAYRALLGEMLLRYMLIKETGLQNEAIEFTLNEFGKPYLAQMPNCYFNLSHSGEWVVAALGDSEVGIDIEQRKEPDLQIAERFFTESEHASLLQSQAPAHRFYELWSCKESYIKAIGTGMSTALDSFEIRKDSGGLQCVYTWDAEQSRFVVSPYLIKTYELDPGYATAACSSRNRFPDEVRIVSFEALLSEMQIMRRDY